MVWQFCALHYHYFWDVPRLAAYTKEETELFPRHIEAVSEERHTLYMYTYLSSRTLLVFAQDC